MSIPCGPGDAYTSGILGPTSAQLPRDSASFITINVASFGVRHQPAFIISHSFLKLLYRIKIKYDLPFIILSDIYAFNLLCLKRY